MPDQPTRPAPPKKSVASEERGAIPAPTPTVLAGRRRLLVGGIAAGPVLFAASTRSALAQECRSPSQIFSGNISQDGPKACDLGLAPEYWKRNLSLWNPLGIDSPKIELRDLSASNGNIWHADGTGDEPLGWFKSEGGALPKARIQGSPCVGGGIFGDRYFDFGAAFASIFTLANSDLLAPVVPTMRGTGMPNCQDGATYLIDDREVSYWEVLAFPNDVSTSVGEFASVVAAAYLNSIAFAHYPVTPGQVVHMWNDSIADGYFCPTSGCKGWSMDRTKQYLKSTWGAAPPVS